MRNLIILLFLLSLLGVNNPQIRTSTSKVVNEKLELTSSYGVFPWATIWGTHVHFIITMKSNPLNLTVPGLLSVEYTMFGQDKKFYTNLLMNFNQSVDLLEIRNMSKKVSRKILEVFNHTQLRTLYRSWPHDFNNKTKTFEIFYQYGYLPYNIKTALEFLKFKPNEGFGELIDENFLRVYIPGNITSGAFFEYKYKCKEKLLILEVQANVDEIVEEFGRHNTPFKGGKRTVDLQKLLRKTPKGITEESVIELKVWNYTREGYIMKILELQPYTPLKKIKIRDCDGVECRWKTEELDNIRITLLLEKEERNKFSIDLSLLTLIIAMASTTITMLIIAKRYAKTKDKNTAKMKSLSVAQKKECST